MEGERVEVRERETGVLRKERGQSVWFLSHTRVYTPLSTLIFFFEGKQAIILLRNINVR